MDSFYDVPRRAPAPTQINKVNIGPAVPEVSLIGSPIKYLNNSDTNAQFGTNVKVLQRESYTHNIVSNNMHSNGPIANSRNCLQQSSQFYRKQVRFESPVLQQRPSLTYEPFITKKQENQEVCELNLTNFSDHKNVHTKISDMQPKQKFEEIYMANIPNRHLDLSMMDIPRISTSEIVSKEFEKENIQQNKENELPKTYKEFLETQDKILKAQKNDHFTDNFNYKRNIEGILNETQPQFFNSHRKENVTSSDEINFAGKYWFNCNRANTQQPVASKSGQDEAPCRQLKPGTTLKEKTSNKLCSFVHNNSMLYRPNSNNYLTKPHSEGLEMNEYCRKEEAKDNRDFEPTNRDLLKIIAQQNEQLILLQKQVALLLNREQNCEAKPIESAPIKQNADFTRNQIDEEHPRFLPELNLTPRKRGLSKFSVDVMTSFEVAIRPQTNRQAPINYNTSKIQEITEEENTVSSSSDKKKMEQSLHLVEPMKVVESCPSPEPSININMNDYDSSDDEVTSEIGATFYHNLMGQVNNILKQAQIQTREEFCSKGVDVRTKNTCSKVNRTMHRVREATLKHLKDIGVTIGPMEEDDGRYSGPKSDCREYSPTEISYGVKQLLMKYLPDEHLARTSNKPKQPKIERKHKETNGIMETKADFSFASLQYMQKYNLLPPTGRFSEQEKPSPRCDENTHKILDLTALKMQPKLL